MRTGTIPSRRFRMAPATEWPKTPSWLFFTACFLCLASLPPSVEARPRLGGFLRKLQERAAERKPAAPANRAVAAATTARPGWELFLRLKKDRPDRIPWKDELEYGEIITAKMIKAYGGKLLPMDSHRDVWSYVNLVARVIARVCMRPDMPQWKVGIVENAEVGAISAPGGYILVTTGALRSMEFEAELAGVLAHEMAHVCRRHGLHVIWSQSRKGAVFGFLGAMAQRDEGRQFLNVLNGAMDKATRFELESSKEFEADELAADWMYRAGYHPGGLVRFLKHLPPPKNNKAYEKHPSTKARIDRITRYVKEKLPAARELGTLKERYGRRVLARLP